MQASPPSVGWHGYGIPDWDHLTLDPNEPLENVGCQIAPKLGNGKIDTDLRWGVTYLPVL